MTPFSETVAMRPHHAIRHSRLKIAGAAVAGFVAGILFVAIAIVVVLRSMEQPSPGPGTFGWFL